MMRFRDRRAAGRELGELMVDREVALTDPIVLGLPRGGVPVAAGVSSAIGAPLDVLVVRKLGVPGHEEFAMGAIASGGAMVLDVEVTRRLGISDEAVDRVTTREGAELERREEAYRRGRPELEVGGRTAILVDDGIATGSTMQAAVTAIRSLDPERVVVATPVAPPDTVEVLSRVADDVIVVAQPTPFLAVGYWYDDFTQTSDAEVVSILESAGH